MKANEAPEKLFLLPNGLVCYCRSSDEDIEYTRTDTFIEKAREFFEEYIREENCKFGSSEWTELRAEYESLDSFIRAFENYMKGE